jgi:hypothetical protein
MLLLCLLFACRIRLAALLVRGAGRGGAPAHRACPPGRPLLLPLLGCGGAVPVTVPVRAGRPGRGPQRPRAGGDRDARREHLLARLQREGCPLPALVARCLDLYQGMGGCHRHQRRAGAWAGTEGQVSILGGGRGHGAQPGADAVPSPRRDEPVPRSGWVDWDLAGAWRRRRLCRYIIYVPHATGQVLRAPHLRRTHGDQGVRRRASASPASLPACAARP